MRLIIKYLLIILIAFSSISSAIITAFNFFVHGANNYEHYPSGNFWGLIWAIGLPGSIIIMLLAMGAFISFMITVGNWIFWGKFKYIIED